MSFIFQAETYARVWENLREGKKEETRRNKRHESEGKKVHAIDPSDLADICEDPVDLLIVQSQPSQPSQPGTFEFSLSSN